MSLPAQPAHICQQADLTALNTMRLACVADRLVTFDATATEAEIAALMQALTAVNQPLLIISGGSNLILPPLLHATVVRPMLQGIRVIKETEDRVDIEVMAGENWHALVLNCVDNGRYGLENLALIPGLTGAAPVQNIGAYGVQLEDRLTHVRALHLPTFTWHTLDKVACAFGYRDSKFKREAGQWLITKVGLRLHKDTRLVSADYGDVMTLAKQFATDNSPISPANVMQAIIAIRQSKLPDPKQLPNCGSYFKNPIIASEQFLGLQQQFPNIVGYPVEDSHSDNADKKLTKVAAGWLIDAAGLKGQGIMPILTHTQQALVLVNHQPLSHPDTATQANVLATQQFIQQKIKALFGILLEPEPVWIDAHPSYPAYSVNPYSES